MVWLTFILSAGLVVFAATRLAEYGDVIAVRTRLSGMFIGTLLLAGATSLPELLSALSALSIRAPDLAAGSLFGSNLFNMFMLALLDLVDRKARILRRVAMNHALTASLAVLLTGMATFFLAAGIDVRLGWFGADSLLIIVGYLVGVRLLQQQGGSSPSELPVDDSKIPSLRRALLGFSLAVAVLVAATPLLVRTTDQIGVQTGLSAGFVGAALLAVVTSLPELVATIAAVRLGAFDLAVGNLFGSNLFNMFALGLTDLLYFRGRFLSEVDSSFALVGLLGIILTAMGLIGNLARMERRILFVEIDALLIMIGYFFGMWFLYSQGIGL